MKTDVVSLTRDIPQGIIEAAGVGEDRLELLSEKNPEIKKKKAASACGRFQEMGTQYYYVKNEILSFGMKITGLDTDWSV
jgi:hypothetical protein